MKNLIISFIMLFGITNLSFTQWQGDTRLTNNSFGSFTTNYNNAKCVASEGNFVHITWQDNRDGNSEIYYKRSTDAGLSWGADTRLTNDPGGSNSPSIVLSGALVHIVFFDTRIQDNFEIFYKRSTDNGNSWSADTRLTNDPSFSILCDVSVSASDVHVIWEDRRDGNDEIYYKRSTDGGISWEADVRLTNNVHFSYNPSVSSVGSIVHVVWFDHRDVWPEIYYKRSTDRGVTWGPDTRLTPADLYDSFFSALSVSGSNVDIVWTDGRDLNFEIYHIRSTNEGVTWGPNTRLTFNDSIQHSPTVHASGNVINVVWEDQRDGNLEIYNKRSTDGGINWGADSRLTSNPAVSDDVFIYGSGSAIHIVWRDNRHGATNYEIYYKRDPTGNAMGVTPISSEVPIGYNLSQNYPNPFNPVTNIEFSVPKSGHVTLSVFDILGREVAALVNEKLSAGTYRADFDASHLTSGVYFYMLEAENFYDVKKMIFVK